MGGSTACGDRARGRHDRRHAGHALIRALAALGLLIAALPARAASPPAVEAAHFMVVSANRLASEAGAEMLRAGGNAVDAAVATGYALAVVDPCCGNIGGGGFMTLHLANGRDIFLNFREEAPEAATPGMYLDAHGQVEPGRSLFGWRAVGVPGTVLGLDTALREYGTMPRARVMAPAIRLAREGFPLGQSNAALLALIGPRRLHDDPEAARLFFHPDGTPLAADDQLVQPALADTLAAIATHGPDAFYRGTIPGSVAAAARTGGGVITAADFAHYTVTESPPVRCRYHGWVFISAAPPSSGGVTLCEMLDILSGFPLRRMGFHSAATVHVMVEAMRRAFLDRDADLGDPHFVHNPLSRLLSRQYAEAVRAKIGARATPSAALTGDAPHEHAETTHFSVLDAAGNAVSVTYSLNAAFGAGVMAPGAGFLLNDTMDDFTIKPGAANMFGLVQGSANAIAPGKRPLSSMAPTIVLRDGKVALVLGSPGGPRIITVVLETALNVLEFGMAPQEAVDAPRFHHQALPDTIFAEPRAFSPDTEAALRGMGYSITTQSPWGAAELIAVGRALTAPAEPSSGNDAAISADVRPDRIYGASDPRRPAGAAVGQ